MFDRSFPVYAPHTGEPPRIAAASLCRRTLILVGFSFVFSVCALGAGIEGQVVDPSGRPVARANVTLLRSLAVVSTCQTNGEGHYHFDKIGGGTYRLAADAPGLSALSMDLGLQEDEVRRLNLKLQLSAVAQQVVVSATFGGALVPQVGTSVSVLAEADIKNRDAVVALEVLRGTPGVEVNQSGRHGGVTGLFIRGGNSNYNLVMVDGIPLNDFGGNFNFASIPTDGVATVEVVRGPQSALYGSNAVTGVVNIVSRKRRKTFWSLRLPG